MQKVREEITNLDTNGQPIDRSHLRSLKYLQNVLKESKIFPLVRSWAYQADLDKQLSACILPCLSIHARHSRRLFFLREAAQTGNRPF